MLVRGRPGRHAADHAAGELTAVARLLGYPPGDAAQALEQDWRRAAPPRPRRDGAPLLRLIPPVLRHPGGMTATCIVLNGPSCSGKSSIAAVLQELWPGPLQVTGLDTFLAAQSRPFLAGDGRMVAGFSWIPVTVDGQPAFDVVPGPLGLGMIRASHAYWAACAEAGLDQVIDDVWLVPDQPAGSSAPCPPRTRCGSGCIARCPSPSSGNGSAVTVPSAPCAASTPWSTRTGHTT